MNYKDGNEVRIIYCKDCGISYFSKKISRKYLLCPGCGRTSVKLLANNNRIPGWFGKDVNSLIDIEEAKKHLECIDKHQRETISGLIGRLMGTPKYISISSEQRKQLEELKNRYPNMKKVIDYVFTAITTSSLKTCQQLTFKPMVLVGSPGCGKTAFVAELAYIIMGKPCVKVDLGNDIASFSIVGSDSSYRDSKNGVIAEAMFAGSDGHPIKNPLIHFDELDKIKTDQNYSVENVFYSILEKSSSVRFVDNFLGVAIDASEINYIFTANTLKTIPKPLLSRLECFEIEDYTHEQLKDFVIPSFYEKWLTNGNMEREFLPMVLSEEIKERLLALCHDDTRSIEVALNKVFEETLTYDSETGHGIALFSRDEIYNGWKRFRGQKCFSKEKWKPPINFIKPNLSPKDDVLG